MVPISIEKLTSKIYLENSGPLPIAVYTIYENIGMKYHVKSPTLTALDWDLYSVTYLCIDSGCCKLPVYAQQ